MIVYEVGMTGEELFLSLSTRCPRCKHLSVLHNAHCCEFCTVPGCKCELAGDGIDPADARRIRDIVVVEQARLNVETAVDQ